MEVIGIGVISIMVACITTCFNKSKDKIEIMSVDKLLKEIKRKDECDRNSIF